MNKYLCRHCKKKFNKNKVICDAKNGNHRYFACRKCNTERAKKYRKTKIGKTNIYKAVYKSIDKLRYKQNARIKLNNCIKLGKIHKPILCEECEKEAQLFGHHKDYSKPLEVIWLCRNCHSIEHKKVV